MHRYVIVAALLLGIGYINTRLFNSLSQPKKEVKVDSIYNDYSEYDLYKIDASQEFGSLYIAPNIPITFTPSFDTISGKERCGCGWFHFEKAQVPTCPDGYKIYLGSFVVLTNPELYCYDCVKEGVKVKSNELRQEQFELEDKEIPKEQEIMGVDTQLIADLIISDGFSQPEWYSKKYIDSIITPIMLKLDSLDKKITAMHKKIRKQATLSKKQKEEMAQFLLDELFLPNTIMPKVKILNDGRLRGPRIDIHKFDDTICVDSNFISQKKDYYRDTVPLNSGADR